ncbi:iron(III) transport system substrate-binding protein [Sinobaca qinghaiensis]|uniref:Iron(III) transport system substrate-binding protein n=1 Tax=Sinobaca qinghaiensis TaxID=342944 RepID=A0A419V944_9BACL|nr:ABC transporter substrate-binding protein [Sinobaca qinghaiensis]RKD76439.1 iron(III) transport system substrate-binding protein [Sinobaca qinghaiensis]
MKKVLFAFTAGASLLSLAACGGSAESEADSGDNNSSGEELSFYTSQPDEDANALIEAFNEAHPDIEVNLYRSGTEEVVSKVQAENQAGSVEADVLLLADSVTFESLKEQDLLQSYDSPEAENISEEFIDPDQMYYGTKAMATILAVNTNEVEEMPSSWKDLTAEETAGQTVMPSPLYSGAAAYNAGVISREEGLGWDFFENLSDNDVTIVQGNGGALQSVASGEKSYAMVVDFIAANAKAEGSPVELVYPEEGVPVITEPVGITEASDNVEASQAFVDFILSEEGQTLAADMGYTPLRDDVEVPEGLKTMDELQIMSQDVKTLLDSREEDKTTFSDITGAQ